jgi:hypothetical protein
MDAVSTDLGALGPVRLRTMFGVPAETRERWLREDYHADLEARMKREDDRLHDSIMGRNEPTHFSGFVVTPAPRPTVPEPIP